MHFVQHNKSSKVYLCKLLLFSSLSIHCFHIAKIKRKLDFFKFFAGVLFAYLQNKKKTCEVFLILNTHSIAFREREIERQKSE